MPGDIGRLDHLSGPGDPAVYEDDFPETLDPDYHPPCAYCDDPVCTSDCHAGDKSMACVCVDGVWWHPRCSEDDRDDRIVAAGLAELTAMGRLHVARVEAVPMAGCYRCGWAPDECVCPEGPQTEPSVPDEAPEVDDEDITAPIPAESMTEVVGRGLR